MNANPLNVSGTADPGSTVTVKDAQGNTLCTTLVPRTGAWTCPATITAEGPTTISVTVTDAAGNVSDPTTIRVTVDNTAPAAPIVTNPTPRSTVNANPLTINGTAEPGSTVTVADGQGNTLCQATADSMGSWSCQASIKDNGAAQLVVTTTDAAGNVSSKTTVPVTVNNATPATPAIDRTDGTTISGQVDPGSTVTVFDQNGNPVAGCVNIVPDAQGNFSCTPTTPLSANAQIQIVATDKNGTKSAPAIAQLVTLVIQFKYPTLSLGETQTVTGSGFAPGEAVHLTVESTPLDVGTQIADSQGVVVFTFDVPANFETGTHTATFTSKSGTKAGTFGVTSQQSLVSTGGSVTTTVPLGLLVIVIAGAALLVVARRRMVTAS